MALFRFASFWLKQLCGRGSHLVELASFGPVLMVNGGAGSYQPTIGDA